MNARVRVCVFVGKCVLKCVCLCLAKRVRLLVCFCVCVLMYTCMLALLRYTR